MQAFTKHCLSVHLFNQPQVLMACTVSCDFVPCLIADLDGVALLSTTWFVTKHLLDRSCRFVTYPLLGLHARKFNYLSNPALDTSHLSRANYVK
ncbi:hypothetical protein C8R11_10563 [Nitrosomonas aestuarii]|nr:hypothetical protein C8R11_10563 [Nitrosomonas aestuarii]